MESSIFLLAVLAHLISDFILQTEANMKKRISFKLSKSFYANILHSFIHFFIITLSFFLFTMLFYANNFMMFYPLLLAGLLIALSHFIIDQCKSICIIKEVMKNKILLFFIDQGLHILMLYTIIHFMVKDTNINAYLAEFNVLILIIIIILLATVVTGITIRKIIEQISGDESQTSLKDNFDDSNEILHISIQCNEDHLEAKNGGFWIGILERLFIITVVLLNQPMMIGFVLTAKSIARFKKLDDERFAEYYIIGTLISFMVAIISGYAVLKLL
ncbi:DUF3307 domain-containing protein [Vallitalea okinawensis]|uniref:DUF3307 domain-containing protein n=1 Tax=Vallitalea okinawensis TaxID=2078660 RepID=UPI00130023B1|nr:DUF3307 domain-containing protein [Vallitalea okinawensis]